MSIVLRAKTIQGFTVDSPLTPFFFPDGAAHIKGVESEQKFKYQMADVRGLSHDDLFALVMWANVCEARHEKKVVLLPYLPGARADRGTPNGAAMYAEFLCQIVAADQTITLDPHSDEMPQYFDPVYPKLTVFPVERIIKKEVQDAESDQKAQPYVGVIAPDKGAVERASRAAKVMGVPVYKAEKSRDFETGALTGFHMMDALPSEGRLLIVDDICDGGGTFIGLAEATGLPLDRLDLWVTHGIFSKGVNDLLDHFGTIHTTDSYTPSMFVPGWLRSVHRGDIVVHPVLPYLTSAINV